VRIVYLANNRLGVEVLKLLKAEGEALVGLGLHPPSRRAFGDDLLEIAGLDPEQILPGESICSRETIARLRVMEPDMIVSILFGYILSPEVLEIPEVGCINLHPSYLPYNRGTYPNVWSIVEGTPAGVTLHYIDKGVDTGAIIAQKEVEVLPTDTGETLYRKLERASIDLFAESWPRIRDGRLDCLTQHPEEGTCHRVKDVERIDCIDLDARYTGRYLIDVLRARTFPPHRGAYFEVDGRRVYMRLDLQYEEDF